MTTVRRAFQITPLREVFGVDLRTLALFRVLLGLFLILDLALRARDLTAHYTDFGIMPREFADWYMSPTSFTIHTITGSTTGQALLFALAGFFALMLVIGWRTRAVTIISWALLLSLQNRNTMVLSGEDNLIMLLMFWAMFLPLGARFSIDAALNNDTTRTPNAYFSVATLALLIQGMSMYLFSALLKSDPIWMPNGTAVYYALSLDYFVTPFALWFRQFETVMQGLTYYVWTLELIGPILIFSPIFHRTFRATIMFCFITMHLGLWMCLEIGLFPLISIIMNLTFMPGWMWDRLAKKLTPNDHRKLGIWYDRDCAFCYKMCRIIMTFLILDGVRLKPAQSNGRIGDLLRSSNSWVVTDKTDDHLKWSAFQRLAASSPLLWPIAGLLARRPFTTLGDGAYALVARYRSRLSTLSGWLLPQRPVRTKPGHFGNSAAALALVFISIQNISTLPQASLRLPDDFRAVRQLFGLYQNWTMFAPHPEITSPWPVIRGRLANGIIVDPYSNSFQVPTTERPKVVSAVYENYRWRKFISQLEDQSYDAVPQRLANLWANYLCRAWDKGKTEDFHLVTLEIAFIVDWTPLPGNKKPVEYNSVLVHQCRR